MSYPCLDCARRHTGEERESCQDPNCIAWVRHELECERYNQGFLECLAKEQEGEIARLKAKIKAAPPLEVAAERKTPAG